MVSLLVVTALLALAGGQQLELQQELHQLRASGAVPTDDQLLSPHEPPVHEPRVLPSVVAADHSARTAPPPPQQQQQQQHQQQVHHQHQQQQRRQGDDQFPRYVEETVDLSAPLDFSTPLELSAPLEPVAEFEDEETWRRRPVQRVPPTTERATERTHAPHPTEPTTVDPRRPTEVSERPTPTAASPGPWLAEEERRAPPPPAPSAFDSSLQLYSDAWDLNAHSESEDPTSAAPVDDSLSALEYELAAYNVTLFDAAMDYLLHDAANLSTLLPEVTKWKGDDANMTRSIAVMDALFTALQARLGDQDSILQRYGLPETSGFNARPVRRTWADANGRPVYRRNRPVVHRFRPHVDERFLGDRASCGSCQFNLMCWMSGGVARGGCGGFMFVCCDHGGREAKSFNPPPQPQVDYGPVRNDPGCGLSDTSRIGIQRRIVGGNQAGFGTFPWQAYILIGTSRCGGSLINRQHVITAGHCVARARPGQITITLGDYVLNSNREPLPAYKFKVRAIQVHPQFQFTPQADRYDVAVLTLDRPVPYAPHIQPICLPEKGEEFEGYYGWAAGWGALRPGSRVRPKELQVVDVPVINRHMCEQWHRQKGINVIIHEEMMCAGYINGGKDSCQGDSGGPLMIESDGRWYLMGIVSAGYSCAQGKQPGIYHRVSMTSDWISYVAGN